MELDDEQKLLRASVERFIAEQYDAGERRRIIAADPGFRREHWQQFAELGWLAAPFAEADGGLGGSLLDVMVIMEGLGRGIFAGPYLSTVVLAGGVIARARDELKARLLPGLMDGTEQYSLAYAEPQSRYELNDVRTRAVADGEAFRLSGHKSVVWHAGCADKLIVSARTEGNDTDEAGVSLFVVEAEAQGLHARHYPTVDGHRAAEVRLDGVRVGPDALIGERDQALALLEEVVDEATVAVCAEALGCAAALFEQTLAYLKQRRQFGQTIGSFQALQHRMVDMYLACELTRSMTYAAGAAIAAGPGVEERKRWASAAKVQVGKAGRSIGQEAVQLHGGMGMTDELPIGHYFKRLTAIGASFGDVPHHLERFRALGPAGT